VYLSFQVHGWSMVTVVVILNGMRKKYIKQPVTIRHQNLIGKCSKYELCSPEVHKMTIEFFF
jgi:hypothetical protein